MQTYEKIFLLFCSFVFVLCYLYTILKVKNYDLALEKRKRYLENIPRIKIKDIRIGTFINPYIKHKPVSFRLLEEQPFHYRVKILNNNLYNKNDPLFEKWKAGNVTILSKITCNFV
jgi:hypothetical protein